MARATLVQTNFTAGELTPRLHAHTDIDRYNNGARTLVNALPVVHGGARRRPGTRFVKATKIAAKRARLIPFVVSRTKAYMLEVGDTYLRVYKAGGVDLATEVATSYTEAMLPDMDYTQGIDTMFLFHQSVFPQRLITTDDTTWAIGNSPFTETPYDNPGTFPAATLTPGAKSPLGKEISLATGPLDGAIKTNAGLVWSSTFFLGGKVTVNCVGHGYPLNQAVKVEGAEPAAYNGVFVVNSVPDADHYEYALIDNPGMATKPGTSQSFTAQAVFAGGDVGKVIKIDGGAVKITAVHSSGAISGTIQQELSSDVTAPQDAWSLHAPAWSASRGYPRTGTLYEQRLVAAGSPTFPQTIWGSATGSYLDYTQGTADDDAYSFTIASDEVKPIMYLASARNLIVHSYGGEYSVQGGVEKPITPTNVRARLETSHGAAGVRPVTVGKESVFVQSAGRKVRALAYRADEEGYSCPDIAVMSEHITAGGIVEMSFQQEPDMLLWAARGDGALLSCTFDREQSVMAWAKHYTDGAVESVATIPNGDRDETWMIVRRTVNGATVRYIEIMDDTFQPQLTTAYTGFPPAPATVTYGYTVDCGVAFDNALGQSTFSVPHLIGKTVDIVADGRALPPQVVPVSGSIDIDRSSQRTLIGLHFDSDIGLLAPEVGTGTGSAQGNSMRVGEITLSLLDTLGAKVIDGDGEEQEVPWNTYTATLDAPPVPFTGLFRLENLGWERGRSEITIRQDQPLPLHVRAVIRKVTVND